MELNVGRVENRTRYKACIDKIKKAFADYRRVLDPDAKEVLVWSGDHYKLKETGEFVLLDSTKKNNIQYLEEDLIGLQKFVSRELSKVKKAERAENGTRYKACVDKIKKAFADYRSAFLAETKKVLVWSGEHYKIKETGEFNLLYEDDKNDIHNLEKDVEAFQEFVHSSLSENSETVDEEEGDEEETDIDTLVIVKDCIEKNVPNMECFMLDIIKDDLYWITSNKFTFEDVNTFVNYVRRVFPYKTLWIIPKEFSTLDFEKDKNSEYMVSIGGTDEKSEATLPSMLSRLITMMKSLGVHEGLFETDDVIIGVVARDHLKFRVCYNSTDVTMTLYDEDKLASYSCISPSKEEKDSDVEHIINALGKYCKDYDESEYSVTDVRDTKTSKEDIDKLFKLFVEILNS